VDLRIDDRTASAAERQAVDAVLGPPDSSWVGGERSQVDGHSARGGHAARDQRHLLLPTLHAVQARVGWISPGALGYVCRRLTIPPAEAYGVASFYALFSLEPQPPVVTHVCTDIACMCRGGNELVAELERTVGPAGAHPQNGRAIWLESPCLGLCERAPAALVTVAGEEPVERSIAPARAEAIAAALHGRLPDPMVPDPIPQRGGDVRLLRRAGVVDPESLDSYRAHGGYEPLRRAFALGQAGVIREVTESKLLGRGGAAFRPGASGTQSRGTRSARAT
jgi:NADH-quinone oxidoreductase subunit F